MSKYDVNIKRLGLLLLPTFLRRPLMTSLLYAVLTPLNYLHMRFMLFRQNAAYRLGHNGQVCYLRAVLNDTFDPELRRITVTDTALNSGMLFAYVREADRSLLVPLRNSGRMTLVDRRGFGGISGFDFVINVPLALRGSGEARLMTMANTYKLASKRFAISYF